ncbi:MAG: hypothetical protein SF187_26855 [Deltaproteobacteria bacterium]|nr:hypothetical protein [Deltaproteobacteria bacterium]
MKRLILCLCAISAAGVLATAGCDDEDDGPVTPVGDAAIDGPVGPAMCVATFAAYNRTTLEAGTSLAGKCASAADLNVVCANDVGGAARTCGRSCFLNGGGDDCTSACVKQTINPSVSDVCLDCYKKAFNCTIDKCQVPCSADSSSTACISCQQQNGCLSIFYMCSGLPAPSTGADAGADASAGN